MKRSLSLLSLLLLGACATLATPHDDSTLQPSAGVGPFRKLTGTEVRGVAPFVLDDFVAQYRDPDAILEKDGSVSLVAVADAEGEPVVVLTRSTDGRSFVGGGGDYSHSPRIVVRPSFEWEGGQLASPSVIDRAGERWIYYATAGGIGAAKRVGLSWEKQPQPVLETFGAASPSGVDAVEMPDGSLHLFYVDGGVVGEASSTDGIHFTRLDQSVFRAASEGIDSGGIADVNVSVQTTAGARVLVTMLYTAIDASGVSSVGLAGRFGENGPFERHGVAVYAVGKNERAPTSVQLGDLTFLYVTQTVEGSKTYPAIAAAVAPADRLLDAPSAFPENVEPE